MATVESSKAYGQRMRKLEHAFQRTVKYSLRGVSQDDFYAYFPEAPLSDVVIDTTYDGYKQGLQQARTASEVDFQNICEEHSIVDKLYTLDMMCAQQGIGDGATEPVSSGAAPIKAARFAALKAKKEESKMLLAIAEETERREAAASQALESNKRGAKELMDKAQSVGGNLAEVHAVASAWTNRGRAELLAKSGPAVGPTAPMEH